MNEQYLSVSQVNNYIKNIFEAEIMLQNICIYGEVSSYKISNNIAYFNLADSAGLISCVLFNANKFNTPNVGDVILAVGSVSYYAKGGKLSFNANHIAPYGKGVLYEKFLQLKAELESKGYFDSARKKPLPARVNKIGVVTSSTGAVIQDIINVTTRRNSTVNIVLYPVKVQGVGAEFEIAQGINFFSNYDVDVVIVARGGGSIEDLQPFNTEVVATATYNCKRPIVSAVGHETDFTIIDFVSDLRAPTPSAAAECVVNELIDDYNLIDNYFNLFYSSVVSKIDQAKSEIDGFVGKSYSKIENKLLSYGQSLNNGAILLQHMVDFKVGGLQHKIELMQSKIESLNPVLPLNKGYVKVETESRAINSVKDVVKGKQYNLVFKDGSASVTGV